MNEEAAREGGRLRLHYLDGLRGIAALWVVLHHGFMEVAGVKDWLPASWQAWTRWAWNGQVAVQVFIVLSGYCLMLPVARSGGLLKGGVGGFIARRLRRILPPYYAALALSLAVIVLVPGMGIWHGVRWDASVPVFSRAVLVSHVLLLQDLQSGWITKIDYPMWTIAQEWQLYFVFALVLLPLWRRAGIVVTLAAALVVSIALRRWPGHDFGYASPEFLFLFTVGVAAAAVNFSSPAGRFAATSEKLPWGWLAGGGWALYALCVVLQTDPSVFSLTGFALLVAPAMFCTLVYCTRSAQDRRGGNFLLRACEWQPAVVLGTFSYSLYLVHAPVLGMCTLVLRHWQTSGSVAVVLQLLVVVPLASAVSYGFYLVAERPFLLGRPATLPRAEKAAILDPAP